MAVQAKPYRASRTTKRESTKGSKRSKVEARIENERQPWHRFLAGWVMIAIILAIVLPNVLSTTFGVAGRALNTMPVTTGVNSAYVPSVSTGLAPVFTKEVDYWSEDIVRWAAQFNLDPNLLATVMQIESCGLADVSSHAGAQGLFQVMPFHFSAGENMIDPDTNARRGADFLNQCLGWANGDSGLAMACYNGGPSVVNRSFSSWASETQRYYNWGTAIYADAQQGRQVSDTIETWLRAGGTNLCNRASASLGLD